jgi:mannitol-1-phosphate/altronate dehydrogenase
VTRLSLATLDRVPAAIAHRRQPRPLAAGIVHFGPGAFHRAHQAAFIDRLLDADPRWGIVGVGLRSGATVAPLAAQDGLYTLVVRDAEAAMRVIAAHVAMLGPGGELIARLADPGVALVTATVTEKGYALAADGTLDFGHPDIVHDLAAPALPKSFIGWTVAGLAARRAAGLAPFAVLSCDNMADNGAKLRAATIAFATRLDPELAAWIAGEVGFPSSMVDSITPASDDALLAEVAARLGLEDAAPVQREAFAQWVIEDQGRPLGPDLAGTGVILTRDVAGYERAKLRILNGSHSALADAGLLAGHETVAEAMADAALADFVERLVREEVVPALPPVPGLDLHAYADAVFARFRNPAIRHRLIQIAMDGSQKLPYRWLDTIIANLRAGRPAAHLACAVAAWIAFAIRQTAVGIRLYVDGIEAARKDQKADLDSGLDQFGLAGRIISPHQVQSRYSYMRGSDVDEIRIYDHMLGAADVAALARNAQPGAGTPPADASAAWLHRYGWDKGSPPALTDAVTRIRKIEFADARDMKEQMFKGIDGIAETTWPGVYNRSRLPGRDDYFELPDWNVYVEGGKAYDLTVPANERFNRVEIRGAAYGTLSYAADGAAYKPIDKRPEGEVRSWTDMAAKQGGKLRFTNSAQETPIQEIWAYDIGKGEEPAGSFKLSYKVHAGAAPSFANLNDLVAFIDGRYPPDERSIAVALPAGGGHAPPGATSAASQASGGAVRAGEAPIVHILIPSGFDQPEPDRPLARAWNYGWENVHDGLDGIALDIPPLKLKPGKDGLIPLNIRVKDPIWPQRDMIDVSVSVHPGEARTLWLDLRDRILTNDSFYIAIASAVPDFDAAAIDGMAIRLVFKPREEAKAEHVADRFRQASENWAFLVEEHTASGREALYRRLKGDLTDLLRVDPDNVQGRLIWQDASYDAQSRPAFTQPAPPAGEPLWAFRQLEDLKLVRHFVNWWIDERQVPYGDFGGGISDDVDLVEQWPGLALMGVDPDKVNASVRALSDSVYTNGMRVNGLGYITTDELHAYEEGLNSDAERFYLNWGEPKGYERLMATAKALKDKILLVNPAGHMHFASNWYGGRTVYREGAWEWQKPYSFTVMHAPILLGVYSANPAAEHLVTGVIDGWMAHGKQAADGTWRFPNEINWRSDAERKGDGGGLTTSLQSAWAAYRFTGDAKYLRPLEGRVAESGAKSLEEMNENAIAVLGRQQDWGKALLAKAKGSDNPFTLYTAWSMTGDKSWLDALHAQAIEAKSQHMWMYTEGHWWTDRVDQPNETLQRERLGGIALKRNYTYPGNTVSWRFADPEGAVKVAILVPGATRDRFKVIAYNASDQAESAEMTTWNVTAGTWAMTSGIAADGGDKADQPSPEQQVTLERSASLPVRFAAHATTVLEFRLVTPTTPTEQRPDLGIAADDVKLAGHAIALTVHNLGSVPVSGGTAWVADAAGKMLASVPIPAIQPPLDLVPKTVVVKLPLPAGAAWVRVGLPGEAPEVTMMNNAVALPLK